MSGKPMEKSEKARIAVTIFAGIMLGGAAGAGVGAGLYPPIVAVEISACIGLLIGGWLLRKVLANRRAGRKP
jgi:hypothetical protein